jgi:alpha-1,2-mannosyltransferase
LRPGVVITLATMLGLGLRAFQLSRPGYLSGFTQYDDGVYIGNALRLVNGVIPYRDFAMVQPPGSMLLMVPAALLGKAFGSMWALGAARVLTAGADTANVALIGLLVRHRGPLAAGLASGGYAIYPAALTASQSLFLEPWLILFCLLGALFLFEGDHLAGGRGAVREPVLAGICFGFAAAVKIWALGPALVACLVCLRARRGALPFCGGWAAGLALPCLPFLALAPSGFGRTVFVSELVQATHGRVGAAPRLADITGIIGLTSLGVNPHMWLDVAVSVAIVVLVAAAWIGARRGLRLTALEQYVLFGSVVVTAMMFSPSEWYEHYAAFAGPFLMLLIALSATARRRQEAIGRPRRRAWAVATAVVLAAAIAAMAAADVISATKQRPPVSLAAAKALIPPGACVLTDTVSATIAIDRFSAGSPGCPPIVDTVGTLISTTDGQDFDGSLAVRLADTRVWQSAFSHAQYVWLVGNGGDTGARIVWTAALYAYFVRHFRLLAFPSSFPGQTDVPPGGLYTRRD